MDLIEGVKLTPLKIIEGESGNVLHALKQHEDAFAGFGEAYFSTVLNDHVKGWKKHRKMILNVIVPIGEIHFVLYDDRKESSSYGSLQELVISKNNYQRLTVPPGVWMAFRGRSAGTNMLLNIASIPHDPTEAENLPIKNEHIPYEGFA